MRFNVDQPTVTANTFEFADSNLLWLLDIMNEPKEAISHEITVGNSVKIQIKAIYMGYLNSSNAQIQVFLKLSCMPTSTVGINNNGQKHHRVVATSTALKVNRYFVVTAPEEKTNKLQKLWHVIYDQMMELKPYHTEYRATFDLKVQLVAGNVGNETAPERMALSLLADEETTDVELEGTDGKVRAHGFVLAAASPVLRAAFFGDFKEGNEKRYSVPDADVKALTILKRFAYTGCVDGEPSVLKTLFPVARRLLMSDLARAISALLVNALTPKDLIPLLQSDIQHPEPYLLIDMLYSNVDMIQGLVMNEK